MKRYLPALLLLVLLTVLVVSQVTPAVAAPSRPSSVSAHPTLREADPEGEEEEFEAEEDEFEFESCEAGWMDEFGDEFEAEEEEFEDEFEFEDEEEEFEESCGKDAAKPAKKGAPFVTAPASCEVRQAESTITTLPASDQVRLTIRYQTYSPTPVTVGLKLKDRKGSVAIERATRHLGDKGVLRFSTKLGSAIMDRAEAASEFDVSLRAPETPGYCAGALEQRLLSAKHTSAGAPRVYAN
jgi:hypothetical protein